MGLSDNPRVYDAIQVLAGRHIGQRRLRRAIAAAGDQKVLDVGAGTGSLASLLPPGAVYWALDNDPAKLRRLSIKVPHAHCVHGSALDIQLPDGSVDWTVCSAVAHHMDDEELPQLFAELARVTRHRLVFLDPLWTSRRGVARLLWRYDRGSHPRSPEALLSALDRHFDIEHVERFRVLHDYVLCSARPVTAR
jgi:SAM-dependent methyltransferase